MTDISPAAAAAREQARSGGGQFGTQTRTAPGLDLTRDCLRCGGQVAGDNAVCGDCANGDSETGLRDSDPTGPMALVTSDSTLPRANDPSTTLSIEENGSAHGGELSVGIEASKFCTWSRKDGLYVTAEAGWWVEACIEEDDGPAQDLEYNDWHDARMAHARATEATAQAEGIHSGLGTLDKTDREEAQAEIDRLHRYAEGLREEWPGTIRYVVKERSQWSLHKNLDDPFSDTLGDEIDPIEEPYARAFASLDDANAEVRARANREDFRNYAPQNAFRGSL